MTEPRVSDAKSPMRQIDASGSVAIVGCGISGILTALLMTDHCPNIRITVIDPFQAGGRLTTFGPAAETLFQPPPIAFPQTGTIFSWTSMFRPRVFRWIMKRTLGKPFDRNEYGAKCREEFKACIARHPELEPCCKREGVLHLAIQAGLNNAYSSWVNSLKGTPDEKHYQYLDPDAAKSLEPALADEKFYGAILSTRDGYIQQERFLDLAMDLCRSRGVQFLFSRRVTKSKRLGTCGQIQLWLTPTDGVGGGYADEDGVVKLPKDIPKAQPELLLFDKVVICAGVDTIRLGGMIGGETLTGEMIPIKGYSITGRKKNLSVVPQRALVYREVDKFCRALYDDPNTHEDDHMYRVGGGVIIQGWPRCVVDDGQMKQMFRDTDLGRSLIEAGENINVWPGLRPATPTNRPLVRTMANNRVFINSGHGFNGFVYPWYSTLECLNLMWPGFLDA